MHTTDQLNDLVLFGLNQSLRYHSSSITAFKSGSHWLAFNRAIISDKVDKAELVALDSFYANTPYRLWINEYNTSAKEVAVQQGYAHSISYPVMELALYKLKQFNPCGCITVRQIASDDEIFTTWVPIVVQSYLPNLEGADQQHYIEQVGVFVRYLQKTPDYRNVSFYLGCWDNQPVATGMFVLSDGFVGIHWIGTLPSFRNRGIGFAVTNQPLQRYKEKGVEKALLFASTAGYPVYAKMGFEPIVNYDVYGKL